MDIVFLKLIASMGFDVGIDFHGLIIELLNKKLIYIRDGRYLLTEHGEDVLLMQDVDFSEKGVVSLEEIKKTLDIT